MRIEIATALDALALAQLRVEAMQEGLEALGLFDPVQVRDKLLANFTPTATRKIIINDELVGFYVLKEEPTWLYLNHLYIHPKYQREKIGSKILADIIGQSNDARKEIRLRALKGSRSNQFYMSHGFVKTHEKEFDNYYVRLPNP